MPAELSASVRRLRFGPPLIYFLLPFAVFVISSIGMVNAITPVIALVVIGGLIALKFLPTVSIHLHVFLWTLLVLTLVGSTGWFFSPLFFALYLLGIALGFVYNPATSVGLTIALITIFAFSVGEVNPTADFLTLLSLFLVIPITIALRRNFLVVQQEKKGILILESEEKEKPGITSLDSVLANRIDRIAIVLRQPLTYLKEGLALIQAGQVKQADLTKMLERMQRSVDDLLTLVKEFESETTSHVLLGRKESPGDNSSQNSGSNKGT